MNGTDPLAPVGGPGYGMKAFLVLGILFIIFMIFASNTTSHINLVDNGNGSAQAAAPANPGGAVFGVPLQPTASAPQVITIQQSPNTNRNVVPVTGSCTDPYTVQAGDSLSQIAAVCNTTMAAIRQANPQITDANLIYPGQQLHIPGAATQPLPVTGSDNSSNGIVPQQAPVQVQPTPTTMVPVTGLYPRIAANTGLQVKGIGYPAGTPVNVEIGPQGQSYTVVANGVTDTNGNITTTITVPASADPNALWVVLVTTTGTPPIQATSQPFNIGPTQ